MLMASLMLVYASHSEPVCLPNPTLLAGIENIKQELELKGWRPMEVEICRSVAQQKEKIRLGYSQTMHSKHLKGRAVDMVDERYYWRIPLTHKFWKDYGEACRNQGFIWGGDWKYFKDVAHCEMPDRIK
jgi:peptidoglycan L-alanyl-D-glutamate endopeptidase CwlK